MRAAAVELDDHPFPPPEAVDLEAAVADLDQGVRLRAGQAGAVEELEEAELELAAGRLCGDLRLPKKGT